VTAPFSYESHAAAVPGLWNDPLEADRRAGEDQRSARVILDGLGVSLCTNFRRLARRCDKAAHQTSGPAETPNASHEKPNQGPAYTRNEGAPLRAPVPQPTPSYSLPKQEGN
jgi:hypothetical protein